MAVHRSKVSTSSSHRIWIGRDESDERKDNECEFSSVAKIFEDPKIAI